MVVSDVPELRGDGACQADDGGIAVHALSTIAVVVGLGDGVGARDEPGRVGQCALRSLLARLCGAPAHPLKGAGGLLSAVLAGEERADRVRVVDDADAYFNQRP